MAEFKYLGAVMEPMDKDATELIASNVVFRKPAILEQNYRSELYDIAKRYRKLKSVDDQSIIMIVPINKEITLSNQSLLKSIVKAEFSYASLLHLSVGTTPVLEDNIYIEAGLGLTKSVDELKVVIPQWYDVITHRLSVKLRKNNLLDEQEAE